MTDTFLGSLLAVATLLVIAGVALEGAEYAQEIRYDGWQLANPWKSAQKLGFALLVIGLAGEWYSSTAIHGRDTDRVVSLTEQSQKLEHDNLLLKIKVKAAEGRIAYDNKVAQQAASDASKLSVSVSNLHDFVKRQIGKNDEAMAVLNRTTANLEKARADALAAATEARSALSEMHAFSEPRFFTDVEKKNLISQLRPFAGRPIVVQSYIGDVEGWIFSARLALVLGSAGLKPSVGYWYPDRSSGKSLLLGMEVDAPASQKDLADTLQRALQETRPGVRPRWFPLESDTVVTVRVGAKPIPIPDIVGPAEKQE